LEFSPKEVVLEEREFTIPNRYGDVIPMFDGKERINLLPIKRR